MTDECSCTHSPVIKGIQKKNCVVHCISDCFNAAVVIPANKNICKNQLVWVGMDFCFFIAKPNQKQLHAPQRGENTCSCVNLNILDAVHKEEHRDMGRNLSRGCEERMSWLAI